MPSRTNAARGFTLIELMVTLGVVAILCGFTAWQATSLLPAWRTDGLARRFALDLRKAQAIAARQNQPVQVQLHTGAHPGCEGAGYRVVADGAVVDSVCLPRDYPGTSLSGAGAPPIIVCAGDAPIHASGCSFCEGGAGTLIALPSGEVLSPGDDAVASLAFAPAGEAAKGSFSGGRAVSIQAGTARVRGHKVRGAAWECP
jgi:prepilin-type N-terminal cleavage/methylation domain-containing protein